MHTVEAVAHETARRSPPCRTTAWPSIRATSLFPIWDALAGSRRTLRFGLQPGLDVYAEQILAEVSSTRCKVVTPVGTADLVLPVAGLHNLRNALAAIAASVAAGAPLEAAIRALAGFSPVAGRMQHKVMSDGTLLIDDSYNANPDSVRVAIDVLARIAGARVLVLGDMGEVGDNGPAMHVEVGNYAREQGSTLITLGEASRAATAAFGEGARACASVDRSGCRPARFAAVLRIDQRFALYAHGAGSDGFFHQRRTDGPGAGRQPCCLSWPVCFPMMCALGVFEYITLRAVLACATALLIGLVAGPRVIRKLTEMKIGQAVRSYGPESHLVKTGTPTMGGVLILISIAISTLLWADWTNRFVWVVLLVTFGFGWIGWMDDYRKVVYRDPEGMPARQKFFWQATIGLVAAVYLAFAVSAPANADLWPLVQGLGGQRFHHVPANPRRPDRAVLQDGQLPAGRAGLRGVDLGRDRGHQQRRQPDRRPGRPGDHAHRDGGQRAGHLRLRGRPRRLFEVPAVSVYPRRFRTDGAVRGDRGATRILWFNAYPAQVFMGDVGALALGGALGTIAVIVRQEIVLFIMGGVFVVETLSVMIQVTWFKYTKRRYGTGRRIFRMAPLHHHFEVGGWKKPRWWCASGSSA